MTTLRVAESGPERAALEIDGYRWDATLTPIFSDQERDELDWYFEEWLRFPFTDRIRARDAALSITRYGQALFDQLFADRKAWAAYKQRLAQDGAENLRFEITGSPAFHAHHWEALEDPDLPQPFVLLAPMLRKNTAQPAVEARPNPSTTFNLLVVTARPGEGRDVGYRTITRPLIQSLRRAHLKVAVDLARPGTWAAFRAQLEAKRPGHYHAVHFDLHGALRHRPGLAEGGLGFDSAGEVHAQEAILAFEAAAGGSDPRTAADVADLLLLHRVPLVVLNACQSGKQVGEAETSLAARLMQAGVQNAIGMAWSLTVTAAERMIPVLYEKLFAGASPEAAILAGRRALRDDKQRRAYMNERIELEDWLLPVVHENRPLRLAFQPMTDEEETRWYTVQAVRSPEPQTAHGFFGRDLDVLRIEKALLTRRNILLVKGMGGSGKTTLLKHLMHWGEITGLVARSVYFGWDSEAWTRARIMRETIRSLYPDRLDLFDRLPNDEARQAMLAQQLRADRHLLVLDNLESVTGERLAIQNSLTEPERAALQRFLAALAGGRSLVLLGSRTAEPWLAPGAFADNIHRLAGLDPEAASDLADAVLARADARERREESAFADLLRLLDGYPLALEVVLPNLKAQSAKDVHDGLQQGLASIDQPADGDVMAAKTKSLIACIEYSHGHLDPAQQTLLHCFAPFSGVIRRDVLSNYVEKLKAEPVLAALPLDDLDAALAEAEVRGLVSADVENPCFLRPQPAFGHFLTNRLSDPALAETRAAIEAAFVAHMTDFAEAIYGARESKQPDERKTSLFFASVEYGNLHRALMLALAQRGSIAACYEALSYHIDAQQDHARGLELGEAVLTDLKGESGEELSVQQLVEWIRVIDDIGKRNALLRRFDEAKAAFEQAAQLVDFLQLPNTWRASSLHQLGIVAEKQRRFDEAAGYCRRSLKLKLRLNDRRGSAANFHLLGVVAQRQRRFQRAARYLRQALKLELEYGDRHGATGSYYHLGMVAQAQGRLGEAAGHYCNSLNIAFQFGDRHGMGLIYGRLGTVAGAQGQFDEAISYLRQSLEITLAYGDRHGAALTYGELGNLTRRTGRHAESLEHYLSALPILAEAGDGGHLTSITLRNLARLWRAWADDIVIARTGESTGQSPAEIRAFFEQVPPADPTAP